VLVEKKHKVAEQYHAVGTPTGVLIRSDGTVGSPAIDGADAIRQFVTNKAWTEAGFAAFMAAGVLLAQPAPTKPTLPGSPLPAFTLPDLDGTAVESATSSSVARQWPRGSIDFEIRDVSRSVHSKNPDGLIHILIWLAQYVNLPCFVSPMAEQLGRNMVPE